MRQELIKIAQVTLKILSKKSWNSLSISEVKQKSKIKIFDNEIKNKHVLLRNINAYFDHILSLSFRGIEQSNNSLTVWIPYETAAGSPGPFDKNTPSGL